MLREISGSVKAVESNIVRSTAPLFNDFVKERYLPFAQKTKRSWKVDRGNLQRHILPYLGEYRLSDITAETLQNWIDALIQSGLAHSTCIRQYWLIKYVMSCAARWGYLPGDMALKTPMTLDMPAKSGRSPVLLSSSELARLLDILRKYPNWSSANAIYLMILTGASKSEILGLRWEDVDLDRGVLAATATFTGRRRLIPLNSEAQNFIQKLPRRDDIPWLFFTNRGTHLTYITRDWYQIRDEFGHPELRLQDLRHSFANFLVSMGVSQNELRTLLGHYKPEALELAREVPFRKGAQTALPSLSYQKTAESSAVSQS
ncbi:site-specific integrase [uncultured Mailhella sp.]|uniref:tyrosine-type recombinase/integrase n=1 Tax=uncultured Mailhella sp. TaxID=1981031 RepID=UPI0026317FC3|nr:site-specific integrase [uncultured Mailhella sp.]